jgi:ABC-type sugar transport system ATPase subunit
MSVHTNADLGPQARSDQQPGPPAVELGGITKHFGGTMALKGIDLSVEAGSIHALVGENGAGKSTCLGVIAGRVRPDGGRLQIRGRDFADNSPRRMRSVGVAAVYQELTIIPELSAQANVFLGHPLTRSGYLRDGEMRARYLELCHQLGVASYPDVKAGHLSVADQQLLEIMRAITSDATIILLDEPTASLAPHERNVMLDLMVSLKERGITLMFVSHNLDEVLRVSDVVTVFRDGAIAAHGDAGEMTKSTMVKAMLGRALDESIHHARRPTHIGASPRVRVAGLSVPGAVENIDLDVRPGEIVGIGGLVGSGRTTLLSALAGAQRTATGQLWMDGRQVTWPHSPRAAQRLGFALLPEDRKTQGLIPDLTGAENIVISDLQALGRFGLTKRMAIASTARDAARGFGISSTALTKKASELSGGNQQKLLLARCAHSRPAVLLADEPTRGIDVGAKAEIIARLCELAASGLSIIFVSSELEEVTAISHRILVLVEGRMVGVLDNSTGDVDEHQILRTIFDSTREGPVS